MKPLIEEHWHIQELITAQKKRADERTYYRDKAKMKQEREDTINAEPMACVKEFYCRACNVDFLAPAIKQLQSDWNKPEQSVAFYQTKHRACGTWTMRHITEKLEDPYWFKSKKIAVDRGKHYEDLIQPFQNGYNLLYGKH